MTQTKHNLTYKGTPFIIPYESSSLLYNNNIIISGGAVQLVNYSNLCYCYSILNEKIERLPDLIRPRSSHKMIQVNSKIFALGGQNKEGSMTSCEASIPSLIDSLDHDWKEIVPLNEAKSGIGACVYDKYIYIFGGKSFNLDTKQLGTIERFDTIAMNKWEAISIMKGLAGSLFGVVPRKYKDKSGFLIFGGINEEEKPMEKTFFINRENLNEIIALENCDIIEGAGFINSNILYQKGINKIWVMGSNCAYYMILEKDGLEWKLCLKLYDDLM